MAKLIKIQTNKGKLKGWRTYYS